MKAVNIDWDVDSTEDLTSLPTEIELPKGMEDEEEISNYLSDVTGFCHKGFNLVEQEKPFLDNNQINDWRLDILGNVDYSDYHKYDSMSIVELKAEREELQSSISNERLWQKGCDAPDDIWMHEENINSLVQELEYVNKKIKELSLPEHQQPTLDNLKTRNELNKESLEDASFAKQICAFKALAEKFGFKVMQSGDSYRLCAQNTDHKWVSWVGFYPKEDRVSYFGETDYLNIWLCDTRKDFTPEKCLQFVGELNKALELTGEDRFLVHNLIDPEDWQEIAQVRDAYEDKRYMSFGIIEAICEELSTCKQALNEKLQSAFTRTAEAHSTNKTPVKESTPER